MKTKFARHSLTVLVVLVIALVLAGTALAAEYLTIPLHNDTAQVGTDCPDDGGAYWHFVINPNNDKSAFIVFHLNLGDTSTYDTAVFIQNGDQWDNVFVAVPTGKTLESLIANGSTADIIWEEKGPQPDSFNLSHVCTTKQQEATSPTVSKTATGAYDNTFTWGIAKSVEPAELKQAAVDATLDYAVTVTPDAGTVSNVKVAGDIAIHNPDGAVIDNITDTLSDGTSCTVTGTSYECSLGALPQGDLTNTVTITWSDQMIGDKHLAAGSASFTTGVINFAENAIDECVAVTDDHAGNLGTVCVGNGTKTFTYEQPVTGTPGTCTKFDNTATFTTNDTGATSSASATAKLCVGANLTVEKTAVPTFTRTYTWDISKAVDKTVVKQFGGSATFNYTVNAWQTSFTDSDWAVAGTITVTNPNDWEDVTATISDPLCGFEKEITVLAGESLDVPYGCALPSGASGTNTATAAWDKDVFYTPTGEASGSADFAFVTPTTVVNQTIIVTDTYAGTLGTLTAMDAEPWASTTFTYSRIVPVPTWNCTTYDNTATIIETGQSASQTVKVCGPIKTGALTMGYWQNKNGQAQITGANCTALYNLLRQYAPFQDLYLATCKTSGIASYVTNVIKAANASGASMNAMLKAQMLATALDVYFYNIGRYSVDLTMICTDLGCAAFEDSSSVFGGTPKTISEMLVYAASQSNVGGSMWYGNVKSTQELAKDAFDAINNQKVFAP